MAETIAEAVAEALILAEEAVKMARFSQAFLQGLLRPTYEQGLFTAAQQAGQLPAEMRQMREEEQKKLNRLQTQNKAFELYRQGLFSANQGDVGALLNRSSDLSQMLESTTDENLRSGLIQSISQLDQLSGETKSRATSNKANAIIQVEQTLAGYEERGDADLTQQEKQVKQALTDRLEVLKQDTQALSQAEEAKRTARLTRLQNAEAMAVAETNAMKRELGNIDPESSEWDRVASKYPNLGSAAKQLRNDLLKIKVEKQENLDKLSEGAPLSPDEIKRIKDLGLEKLLTGNARADRATLTRINNSEIDKRVEIALRPLDPASAGMAKALVIDNLRELAEQGEIEELPIWKDLSDKVENLLEDADELELFVNRVEGLSPVEIENKVIGYIRERFPKQFEQMQTEINRKATVRATKRGALAEIAANTNAARGTAAFEAGQIDEDRPLVEGEEGYFDLNDPDDAERALMQHKKDQRAERQTEQKTAETETGIFTAGATLF